MASAHIQLDDVWMPQGPHVIDFPLYACLGPGHMEYCLRDILHDDFLTFESVQGRKVCTEKASDDRLLGNESEWRIKEE